MYRYFKYIFHVKIQLFVLTRIRTAWIRISLAPWIRIRIPVPIGVFGFLKTYIFMFFA
jgi:hypothetical protein